MGMMIAGIVVNLLVGFSVLANGPEMHGLFVVMMCFWALSFVGMFVALAGRKKAGGIMVIIGGIVFVPIGLIAVIGARKMMVVNADDDLAQRRQAAAAVQPPEQP